jgi:hypothetical protein
MDYLVSIPLPLKDVSMQSRDVPSASEPNPNELGRTGLHLKSETLALKVAPLSDTSRFGERKHRDETAISLSTSATIAAVSVAIWGWA